jgi:hypothetical protein
MNVALWIATGLLALVALTGGLTKTFIPKDKLEQHEGAAWTRTASPGFVKTLGVLELLAAVGLVLPAVVDVAVVMVPVTAVCWIALMVGATIAHSRLGQHRLAMLTTAYLLLAVFVAAGRFGFESFPV